MPVLRSTWCGRFSSPVSLSSWNEFGPSAWCERRMLRRDGEVLRLGTAIGILAGVENDCGGRVGRLRERGLMHETPRAIKPPELAYAVSGYPRAHHAAGTDLC